MVFPQCRWLPSCEFHERGFIFILTNFQLLETAGFEQIKAELVPRITPLQGPLYNWVDMFLRTSSFFEGFRSEEVDAMMHEVQDMCEMDCKDPSSERWMMIYIRLRVSAVFPSSN